MYQALNYNYNFFVKRNHKELMVEYFHSFSTRVLQSMLKSVVLMIFLFLLALQLVVLEIVRRLTVQIFFEASELLVGNFTFQLILVSIRYLKRLTPIVKPWLIVLSIPTILAIFILHSQIIIEDLYRANHMHARGIVFVWYSLAMQCRNRKYE